MRTFKAAQPASRPRVQSTAAHSMRALEVLLFPPEDLENGARVDVLQPDAGVAR